MAASSRTIDDFFQALALPSLAFCEIVEPDSTGSSSAVSTAISQSSSTLTWEPRHKYDQVNLGSLTVGPRRVKFSARVVNVFNQPVTDKSPKAARGCLRVLVKDDFAILLVNLWYYEDLYKSLQLDTLVTIWTTHISLAQPKISTGTISSQPATILTSIFPERDSGCCLQIHPTSCKENPYFSLHGHENLNGVMSLHKFVQGEGPETAEGKILVYVKALGHPTSYTSPKTKGCQPRLVLDVGIADAEEPVTEAILSLRSSHLVNSALRKFIPYQTVLLISYPGWNTRNRISVRQRTQIEVDPTIVEAARLRAWANRWNRPANENVDESGFDDLRSKGGAPPLRHTLATFTRSIDNNPGYRHIAYVPVILSRLNILALLERRRVFCMPCPQVLSTYNALTSHHNSLNSIHSNEDEQCHVSSQASSSQRLPINCTSTIPIFGLHPTISLSDRNLPHTCSECQSSLILRLNPAIMGDLLDETGCLSSTLCRSPSSQSFSRSQGITSSPHHRQLPPILWTDKAYCSLLGRTPEEVGRLCLNVYDFLSTASKTPDIPNAQLRSAAVPRIGSRSTSSAITKDLQSPQNEDLKFLTALEKSLAWSRIILLIGWTGEIEQQWQRSYQPLNGRFDMTNGSKDEAKSGGTGRLVILDVV